LVGYGFRGFVVVAGDHVTSLVVDAASRFEVEFRGVGGVVRRERLSSCWNERFEDVAPVRVFPTVRGQANIPGFRWSATSGRHVGYESWLERDHAMLLDFDPDVVGFSSQPFWLRWHDGRRRRRHAPDYFVRLADGRGVVVDVRADDRIEPKDAEVFEATARACEAVGWQFRRVGEIEGTLAANVRWLAGYRHPRCHCPSIVSRLMEVFADPRPLFGGAAEAGVRLVVLPVLYHLLWCRVLVADLRGALLGPDTLVQVAGR
jgi:hypothetical protein